MVRLQRVSGGYAIPAGRRVAGRVQPPPSKSISQRALNMGMLAAQQITIGRLLKAEDTELFVAALEGLGFEARWAAAELKLVPTVPGDHGEIWCGNNGTMLRFLTAALTTVPGTWIVDGSERLRQRPIGPLVDALVALGGRIRYHSQRGYAPVTIDGGELRGGAVELDASLSSQFVSAVLMAGARSRSGIHLRVSNLVSAPYLALTLDVLRAFGAVIRRQATDSFVVEPSRIGAQRFEVEADFSSAAYPAAAAALTAGEVEVRGVRPDSGQGDRRFLDILAEMGADIEWEPWGFRVSATGALAGVDVDLADLPDQVPTLAALAPFASGSTVIRNVPHLRLKESDRLAAMATELRRLGAAVAERPDGLEIAGTWSDPSRIPSSTITVDTYGDHRIAMSLALCGLKRPGVVVGTPEVVAKSYPEFWTDLDSLIDR